MTATMGIDPGVHGGVAIVDANLTPRMYRSFDPQMTRNDLREIIQFAVASLEIYEGDTCFFEKVGYIRGDGGKGSFTFGRIVGLLEGYIDSHGIRICEVYPAMWQSSMDCLSLGNKNVTKRKAIELFGTYHTLQPITHGTADALLIAAYGQIKSKE